ncbi:MAG TPA: hypothetical protein VGO62_10615 [Myxococcota bacterium]|jgi:hypothetical protein
MITRIAGRLTLVLLVIGCVLLVKAVLGGTLTPTQGRMLASSFGVALYAGLGLACAAVVERQPTSIGARVGILAAIAAGTLFVVGIWTGVSELRPWWQALGVTSVLAFATAHASLLLLVPLDARFGPIRAMTRISSYACALVLTFMIVFLRGDDLLFRIAGLTSTIALFGTLAMPVLAALSKVSRSSTRS